MSFLELARKRDSIRSFLEEPVEKGKILNCLEAARLAPSACNGQPWRFIVVETEPLRTRLGEAAFSGPYRMNSFAQQAPVLVVAVTLPTKTAASFAGFFRGLSYPLIDIGIACDHFILQAEEEGLGTCWLGWFNEKGVRKTLSLGQRERVHILIALGYRKLETKTYKNRKSMSEISEFR